MKNFVVTWQLNTKTSPGEQVKKRGTLDYQGNLPRRKKTNLGGLDRG